MSFKTNLKTITKSTEKYSTTICLFRENTNINEIYSVVMYLFSSKKMTETWCNQVHPRIVERFSWYQSTQWKQQSQRLDQGPVQNFFMNVMEIFWQIVFQYQEFFLCSRKILIIQKETYHIFINKNIWKTLCILFTTLFKFEI